MKELTKMIAFYLPQFHETKENNEWWGEGFTEWVNVKKAKPLFKGHYQPKKPLNSDYYDLLDSSVMAEQSKLAKKYGVDVFCFYHYWFEGRKILEKPIELFLNQKTIDMQFCLSWANGDWSRTWTFDNEILIKQTYGGKKDWEEHFNYLITFFLDSRYIKIENKPVFLLYKTYEISNCDKMIQYWNKRIKEYGFDGIYVIETLTAMHGKCFLNEESQACLEFEPLYTIFQRLNFFSNIRRKIWNRFISSKKIYTISYDLIWNNIVNRKQENKKKTYYGAFPEWDNAARKGRRGIAVVKGTPEKFEKYIRQQYQRSLLEKKEFLFINAWNEWGEGAYLEADEIHKYKYLQAIKNAIDMSS